MSLGANDARHAGAGGGIRRFFATARLLRRAVRSGKVRSSLVTPGTNRTAEGIFHLLSTIG